MSIDFKIKAGDLEPSLQHTLTDQNGNPKDLTGYTVELKWKRKGDTVEVVKAATIVGDPTLGVVNYAWVAGDTDTVGIYDADWVGTIAGSPGTFPTVEHFQFQIYATIAARSQFDILWTDVANFDSNLADLDTGAQTAILAYVNSALSEDEWGGEESAQLRLARIYLAAHYGTVASRGDSATGPVVSEKAGPLARTYGNIASSDSELGTTSHGRSYLSLVRVLPARAPMVI